MALSSNSTTRLGSRMPRLVEPACDESLAPLLLEVLDDITTLGVLLDCCMAKKSWRSQDALQIFLFEVSWIIGVCSKLRRLCRIGDCD